MADYTGKPVGDARPDFILPPGGVKGGKYTYKGKEYRKVLPTAIGFFMLQPSGQIRGFAIQLHENGRIYTPNDARYDWFMAKTALGVADFNHHEMVRLQASPESICTYACIQTYMSNFGT